MSSGGGGGGGGGRVWPPLAKSMSDLDIQLCNGDIKCEECDEPATQHSELKFYCVKHFARCSVAGCTMNDGEKLEHQKSKLLFCVDHAVEGIRNKSIADWDFLEFGVDKEHEDYNCLATHPWCVKCEVRLNEDDLGEWLKNPADDPLCEECFSEGQRCHKCGKWVHDENVQCADNSTKGFCDDCFQEHLEAQVEAHIEQVADSRGGRK